MVKRTNTLSCNLNNRRFEFCSVLQKIMRLFRLKNTGKFGWWVCADNSQEAVAISLATGRAKRAENITVIGDQTDFYKSTTNIDTITTKGIAYLKMPIGEWKVRPVPLHLPVGLYL